MKKTTLIGSLALVTCLVGATAAKAALTTYEWEQYSTTLPGYTSSGTLTFNGTSVVTFSFTEIGAGGGTVNNFTGTSVVLPSGDLQLNGTSLNSSIALVLDWVPNFGTPFPANNGSSTEQLVFDNTKIVGAWVPVPEPTTVFAGALMLLPLGIGAFRAVRKDRMA